MDDQPVLSSNGQRTAEPSASFTPGPWTLAPATCWPDGREAPAGWTGVSGDGWFDLAIVVTRMSEDPFDHPPGVANARLIAAAPDLYYALKLCLQRIERPNLSPDANVVTEAARAALSKAAPPPQGVNATGAEAFPDNHLNEGD